VPDSHEPVSSNFAQSTHDFHYRTWMRLTGGSVPFDEWKDARQDRLMCPDCGVNRTVRPCPKCKSRTDAFQEADPPRVVVPADGEPW
jgi:rubrerythrin